MAAGDGHIFNSFKLALLGKLIDCDTDTFKLALFNKAYAAGQLDGVTQAYGATPWDSDEIVAANYTAGGVSVGTCVLTQQDGSDNVKWDDDGTDAAWTSLGAATIQTALLYDDTPATKYAAIVWEIATNSNGGNYTVQFHANGMMTLG